MIEETHHGHAWQGKSKDPSWLLGHVKQKTQKETHHVVARVEAWVKAWYKDQIEAQFESLVKTRGMA